MEPKTLSLAYDPETDILTIEGVKYTGDFFRVLGVPRTDRLFSLSSIDGVVKITDRGPLTQ